MRRLRARVVPAVLALTAGGLLGSPGAALGSAGVSAPVPAAVPAAVMAGARVAHGATITLDGGALRVRPTTATAVVTRARAVFDARHADFGDGQVIRVAFGAVTIAAARGAATGDPGRLPAFRHTPAWVVFLGIGITPCPQRPGSPPPVPKRASRALVLVVDARTGAAAVYQGAGSSVCAPEAVPHVDKVAELLSVPWTSPRPGRLAVRLPGCARVLLETAAGSPGRGTVLQVVATGAFGPCAARPRTVGVDIGGVSLDPPVRHAPVGPVLASSV